MSSDLPPRPNFEYLKKRAKELLRELQKQNPHAKLADAQHQIAREHGFLNWSQLKEVLQSIANRPEPPVPSASGLFARFNTRARQATFFSRFEAGQAGHPAIDPEHLLLGVLRARAGLTSPVLSDAQLSVERVRAGVLAKRSAGEPLSTGVIIAFSEDTKRVINLAAAEADRVQHKEIGAAHLLLGLLHDERSIAGSILHERGLNLEAVRKSVDELLNEETG
jgi:ClpA/ClpB-like protein